MYKEIYKKKRKWSKFNTIIGMTAALGLTTALKPMVVMADEIYGYGYYFVEEWIPQSSSMLFYLGEGYSNNAIAAIQAAIATMNNNTPFDITLSFATKPAVQYDYYNTIGAEINNATMEGMYGDNINMIAVYTRASDSRLIATDIIVNSDSNWTNTVSSTRKDYQGGFTHELGHALGLLDLYHIRLPSDGSEWYKDYANFANWFTTDESLPTMYGFAVHDSDDKYVYYYLRSLESGDINGLNYIYKLIK